MISSDAHFIIRSSISRRILECLEKNNNQMSPKQIAKQISVARDNVSTRILWLAKRNLVKCVNPEERLWRFYIVTAKGRKALRDADRIIFTK